MRRIGPRSGRVKAPGAQTAAGPVIRACRCTFAMRGPCGFPPAAVKFAMSRQRWLRTRATEQTSRVTRERPTDPQPLPCVEPACDRRRGMTGPDSPAPVQPRDGSGKQYRCRYAQTQFVSKETLMRFAKFRLCVGDGRTMTDRQVPTCKPTNKCLFMISGLTRQTHRCYLLQS